LLFREVQEAVSRSFNKAISSDSEAQLKCFGFGKWLIEFVNFVVDFFYEGTTLSITCLVFYLLLIFAYYLFIPIPTLLVCKRWTERSKKFSCFTRLILHQWLLDWPIKILSANGNFSGFTQELFIFSL